MNGIASRFVMLIGTAAVAPLMIFGAVSLSRVLEGTQSSVREGNLRVAEQVARQLKLYIDNNARVLRSLGQELNGIGLEPWQQSRILKNHVLEFPEFREVTLFDASGRPAATSRIGAPAAEVPATLDRDTEGVQVEPVFQDEDLLPAANLAVAIWSANEHLGWLVARISLEELWRLVDGMRVGEEGYALVFSQERQLVAHGNPAKKRLVALMSDAEWDSPEANLLADRAESTFTASYHDEEGREHLAAVAQVPDLNWTVMVEQPADEAFAIAERLQWQLLTAITLALLGTVIIGWLWSRSMISRIFALTAATRALADGRMDARVAIGGRDEIRQLGDSFNSMADRLAELQEDVRRQERQAMFGKISAGLVHDLSHPIQNIGNSCKLIVRMFDDLEYRETFKRTVDREMVIIRRVLDDLRNVARPIPLERFPIEINRSVSEAVEAVQQQARLAGVTLRVELAEEPAYIEGDAFGLARVYGNLLMNAVQATTPGGSIVVATAVTDEQVTVAVQDTGHGIPQDRLAGVFDDFVTTKRGGLGLGLAVSRRIVEQLDGRITVTSEEGKGATFVLVFPRTRPRPVRVAG